MVEINKALLIIGPTSSGKTSLGLKLAKEFNGEIISADSRQIFKYMDVGTGKVPVSGDYKVVKRDKIWEVNGVGVHMYDIAYPNEEVTVVDFVEQAKESIEDILKRGKVPIIVGGTGFYVTVLLSEQKVYQVPPNYDLRNSLENKSVQELREILKELNPLKLFELDASNPARLVRAIEIEKAGGEDSKVGMENMDVYRIGLRSDRESLFERSAIWVEEVLEGGLIEETKDLIERGYADTFPMRGIVYKQALSYVRGETVLKDNMVENIKQELRQYIKRQETYFKRIKNVNWFDINDQNFDQSIGKDVQLFLNGKKQP